MERFLFFNSRVIFVWIKIPISRQRINPNLWHETPFFGVKKVNTSKETSAKGRMNKNKTKLIYILLELICDLCFAWKGVFF